MAGNLWQPAKRNKAGSVDVQDLGPRLMELRSSLKIPQEDLARLLHVRPRILDWWESGRALPPELYQERISKLLKKKNPQEAGEEERPDSEAETRAANARPDARVLVVDDNPDITMALRAILVELNCEVIEATDGSQVFGRVLEHAPDLVLLDVVMPKVDGFQALEALKRDRRTREVPVFILSATGRSQDFETARRLGARDYIPKPWARDEVERRVAWELGLFDVVADRVESSRLN